MEKEADYIQIMIESLEKKKNVLGQIIELNRQQKFLLQDPNLLPEDLEKNIAHKGRLIEQLEQLDQGFEEVFERIRVELNERRSLYTSEIQRMQKLIKEITEQSNTIQTQEARNKEETTKKFRSVREQAKGVRNSQKVVKQYYDNMMSHRNAGAASVIDNKK